MAAKSTKKSAKKTLGKAALRKVKGGILMDGSSSDFRPVTLPATLKKPSGTS